MFNIFMEEGAEPMRTSHDETLTVSLLISQKKSHLCSSARRREEDQETVNLPIKAFSLGLCNVCGHFSTDSTAHVLLYL